MVALRQLVYICKPQYRPLNAVGESIFFFNLTIGAYKYLPKTKLPCIITEQLEVWPGILHFENKNLVSLKPNNLFLLYNFRTEILSSQQCINLTLLKILNSWTQNIDSVL